MISLIILAITFVSLSNLAFSQLSGTFKLKDNQKVLMSCSSEIAAAKSFVSLFKASTLIKDGINANYACKCYEAGFLMQETTSPMELYYGLKYNELCNCNILAEDKVKEIAQIGLKSEDLETFAGAILALDKMGFLSQEDKTTALSKLKLFMRTDGMFLTALSSEETSLSNIHVALEALLPLTTESAAADFVSTVLEKSFNFVPSGESDTMGDATLIVPLSKLTEKKLRLVGPRLVAVSEQLITLGRGKSCLQLAQVVEGLSIVSTYKASPLRLEVAPKSFTTGMDVGRQILLLRVLDVTGEHVPLDSVEVTSLRQVGKDGGTVLLEGTKFEDNNHLSLSELGLTPGKYQLSISVSVTDRTKPVTHQSVFVVKDALQVVDVQAGISDSKDLGPSDLIPIEKPFEFKAVTANAESMDNIHVLFSLTSKAKTEQIKRPQQVFLQLMNHGDKVVMNYVCKKTNGGDDSRPEFSCLVPLLEDAEKFKYASGGYIISLLVADVLMHESLTWNLGKIDIQFPKKTVTNLPLYATSLLHTSDNTLEALPEIEHLMRPPAKRASSFMAGLFTLLTVSPLVALVLFVLSLKPNLKRLASLSSVGFLLCLFLMLALYLGYWLALDGVSFYQTIKYLCLFFPVTIFVGRRCLMTVTEMRMTEAKTKKN